jgi:hypothetical protein
MTAALYAIWLSRPKKGISRAKLALSAFTVFEFTASWHSAIICDGAS